MKNKRNLKSKGITVIALVITIIILLILSGVAIATLTGENGMFVRAKQAKLNYSISSAKEKLELAISDLLVEQTNKGEDLTKEDLSKINNDKIDVRSTDNFPVEVICGKYKFNVDENFVVKYIGEADETIITYTIEPEGYTNQDKVKVLVKISNPKGIKSIQKPGETDRILPQGQTEVGIDFEVIANGAYTINVVDNTGKEISKDIVIYNFDRVNPKYVIVEGKPGVTTAKLNIKAEDGDETDESSKSGISRYEIYLNGTKIGETTENEYKITNLIKSTTYSVYVIAYDKANNFKQSDTISITTTQGGYPTLTLNGIISPEDELASDALEPEAYDNDFLTCVSYTGTHKYYRISPECWGRYMTFYYKDSEGVFNFGSTYDRINNIKSDWMSTVTGIYTTELIARSVLIPQGSYWGALSTGTSSLSISVYEVWCSNENLSGNNYSNENRP